MSFEIKKTERETGTRRSEGEIILLGQNAIKQSKGLITDGNFFIGTLTALLQENSEAVDWLRSLSGIGAELKTINENLVKIVNRVEITNERLFQLTQIIPNKLEELKKFFPHKETTVSSISGQDLNRPETWNRVPEGLPETKVIPQTAPIQQSAPIVQQPIAATPSFQMPIIQQPATVDTYGHPSVIEKNKFYKLLGRIATTNKDGQTYLDIREKSIRVFKGEYGESFIFIAKKALENNQFEQHTNLQTFIVQGWNLVSAIDKNYLSLSEIIEV